MTDKYAPTINPGDERVRCPYLGNRYPVGGKLSFEILQETVIRTKAGKEIHSSSLGQLPIPPLDLTDPATLATEFPEFNPQTNEPTGRMRAIGEVFTGYFSFVHHYQLLDDARVAAAAAPPAVVPQSQDVS